MRLHGLAPALLPVVNEGQGELSRYFLVVVVLQEVPSIELKEQQDQKYSGSFCSSQEALWQDMKA